MSSVLQLLTSSGLALGYAHWQNSLVHSLNPCVSKREEMDPLIIRYCPTGHCPLGTHIVLCKIVNNLEILFPILLFPFST